MARCCSLCQGHKRGCATLRTVSCRRHQTCSRRTKMLLGTQKWNGSEVNKRLIGIHRNNRSYGILVVAVTGRVGIHMKIHGILLFQWEPWKGEPRFICEWLEGMIMIIENPLNPNRGEVTNREFHSVFGLSQVFCCQLTVVVEIHETIGICWWQSHTEAGWAAVTVGLPVKIYWVIRSDGSIMWMVSHFWLCQFEVVEVVKKIKKMFHPTLHWKYQMCLLGHGFSTLGPQFRRKKSTNLQPIPWL